MSKELNELSETFNEVIERVRREERLRAAEIAKELAKVHLIGGFTALGYNIARAIMGENDNANN